jgi:arabinan endo-1,5-alpha-L-arabinosidase
MPLRRSALAVPAALVALLGVAGSPASAAPAPGPTYTNPVSRDFADTFADPAVVRGPDGWWYAYGTSDPLRSGERTPHLVPTARSADLVTWSYVNDAFSAANRPSWAAEGAALWAPDVRQVGNRWLMYYVVTQTTVTPGPNDNAIGVATAPTPTGPWTDSGAPVVAPRPGGSGNADDFRWTYDPAHLVAADGRQYLYYGSYYGGIYAVELTPDGLRTTGEPTQVAIDNRYEGAYVVPHDGWYYLFASSSNCCAGPVTGYSVFTGRSRSPLGPFLDARGQALTASRTGGTIVVTPNGNRWVGTGHNAVVTDPAGQDWLAYHAIDRDAPYLDEPFGINRRPMLLDRLDWVRGWPVVRAGAYASDGPQPGPATALVQDAFEDPGLAGWTPDAPGWAVTDGRLLSDTPSCDTAPLDSDRSLRGDVRVSGLVRTGEAGFALGRTTVTADARQLAVRTGNRTWTAPIPAGLSPNTTGWQRLTAEVRGNVVTVELGPPGVDAPVVTLTARVGAQAASGRFALLAACAELDDVTAAPLARPVDRLVPTPRIGGVDPRYSDEFRGALEPRWTAVRAPAVSVSGGRLSWTTEAADLTGTGNDAGLLLRAAPAGDYTVETKLTLPLGEDTVRNYQQAGLVVYNSDDDFLRFTAVAIWNTRTTEFGKEQVYAGQPSYGSMLVGPPADTTWLRLSHRTGAAGEHVYRAAVSTDGRTWTWGGSWTLPAGSTPRIGLVSHGANPADPPATAQFDYFRVSRP